MQKKESIYGHFLICYLSLFCLRVLEKKIFNSEICVNEIIQFIRDFNITENGNRYSSNMTISDALKVIKKQTGLVSLDNYYIYNKDINNFLSYEF